MVGGISHIPVQTAFINGGIVSFPLTLSGYLPFRWGPCVTLFIVLCRWLWRTMAVWSLGPALCVCVCVNPHLSVGSAVLRCQERLCDLCVTEGVFHRSEWEPQGERHILCICLWVHACGLWNFIIKRVKTTHCVCFNMSVYWLLPQGWHSQVTVLLKNVIVPVISFFFYTLAQSSCKGCAAITAMTCGHWLISFKGQTTSYQTC